MPGRLVRIIREARQQTRRPGQIGRASAPGCATLGPQALQCAKGSPVGPCHDAPLPTFPTTGPAHRPACANGTPGSLVSIICEARQQMRRPGQIGATPKLRTLREKNQGRSDTRTKRAASQHKQKQYCQVSARCGARSRRRLPSISKNSTARFRRDAEPEAEEARRQAVQATARRGVRCRTTTTGDHAGRETM